jgi:phosphoribosylanthranilate isomerase
MLCDIPVIKAVRVNAPRGGGRHGGTTAADYLLFDAGSGSGRSFEWNTLGALKNEFAPLPPWFLAGGVNPENIDDAIRQNPYCVDVSSGAETGGVKDREKIIRLVRAVKRVL